MESTTTKFKKDYYGGALMVLIGVGAVTAAMSYHIGTLAHMGPGYFPAALGVLLAIVGAMIAFSARSGQPEAPTPGHHTAIPDLRGSVCILLGILAFLFFGKYGGLLPATFAIVFISALGDRSNGIVQAALLAVCMSAIAVVVFWWALQLQLPLFRFG